MRKKKALRAPQQPEDASLTSAFRMMSHVDVEYLYRYLVSNKCIWDDFFDVLMTLGADCR